MSKIFSDVSNEQMRIETSCHVCLYKYVQIKNYKNFRNNIIVRSSQNHLFRVS